MADDGTFVGLLQDELDESLHNLRIMAATLGCSVEILRKVAVGEGQWFENESSHQSVPTLQQGRLWVAEALVKPDLEGVPRHEQPLQLLPDRREAKNSVETARSDDVHQSINEQLRVTLTGATTSGKSSLLGILTSGALDNGRGKSRLGLLKHRHEIVSGMTSSVTQELMGYTARNKTNESLPLRIVNYASADVTSWPDIHSECEGGRLVFFSDSAGHPRYRRTTVRGLVGWAPHWTLLCIPADSVEDTTGLSGSTPPTKDLLGCGTGDIDLTDAHLQICLTLQLPLLIAITKLDLASRSGLKQLLGKLLTTLKGAGRRPILLRDSAATEADQESPSIGPDILAEVRATLPDSVFDGIAVPIICTSAVTGTGISKLHALLHELPFTRLTPGSFTALPSSFAAPTRIFHVEDVFGDRLSAAGETGTVVVSGILRIGHIVIGDVLNVGPFNVSYTSDDGDASPGPQTPGSEQGTNSAPGAIRGTTSKLILASSPDRTEWRQVRVVSLRNLRLSVRRLGVDQVGTLGLQLVDSHSDQWSPLTRIRKGMVLSEAELRASLIIEAEFPGIGVRELSIGSLVVVYVASVRATAKVVLMSVGDEPDESNRPMDGPLQFELDNDDDLTASQVLQASTIVHLRFVATREFVAPGSKILIMPGGGPGLTTSSGRGEKGIAGLDGFVGVVSKSVDAQERLEKRVDK